MKPRQLAGPPCPKTPEHGALIRLNGAPLGRPFYCPHQSHDLEPIRPFFTVEEAAASEATARGLR